MEPGEERYVDTTPQGLEICSAFHPKAPVSHQAGLLTCFGLNAFPLKNSTVANGYSPFLKLTATGIVPVFHRIPF
jgi:hypothetical protein